MANIIYISPEEEVTSLISRLRRFPENDLVLVIPQRAFILESLINMQLLKKELDAVEKRFVIVTQDERGSASAKRAGIEVYPKTYIETIQENQEDFISHREIRREKQDFHLEIQQKEEKGIFQEKQKEEHLYPTQLKKNPYPEKTRPRPITDGIRSKTYEEVEIRRNERNEQKEIYREKDELAFEKKKVPKKEIKDEKAYETYRQRASLERKRVLLEDTITSQSSAYEEVSNAFPHEDVQKIKTFYRFPFRTIFLTILFFGGILFSSFLFLKYLPQATITVVMETVETEGDIEVNASSSGDDDSLSLKIFTENITFTETFSSTGKETSDTRRATGTVTIYNTFSQDPQPLVATTRLLSEDKKVYRLTKSVIVPGKKNENGVDVPGEIKVEVKADEAGEVYNIGISRFTIPGFEGSPKYEAFYAESQEAFIGGGGNSSEISVVTEKDIEIAREKIVQIAKQNAQEKISSALSSDWILIEDTWDIVLENADAFPGVGSVAEKFEYSVVVRARVMSWEKSALEGFIKKKLFATLSETGKDFKSEQWLLEKIDIQYGKATPDFEKESLQLKTFSTLKGRFILEEENFKKDVLGKTKPEINLILEKYDGVREIFIERKPAEPAWLFSRVSSLDSRVVLEVK